MSRPHRSFFTLALLAVALLAGPAGAQAQQSDRTTLQILGVNDFHGAMEPRVVGTGASARTLGGAAYLASYLKRYERERNPDGTIMVHAGDMVNASPLISGYFNDEPALYAMNEMGFDLGTLGNHEFDEGGRELLRLLRGGQRRDGRQVRDGTVISDRNFPGAGFPYIAANTHRASSGRRVLPSTIVLKRKGVKVGFIGVTTEDTPNIVVPQAISPFRISDISDQVNVGVEALERRDVETIIVLAHSGGFRDQGTGGFAVNPSNEIAQEATEMSDEVDAIIAGHTHSLINNVVDGKRIMSAFSSGTAFDVLNLEVDRGTGDVIGTADGEVVDTVNAGTDPDPETQAIVQRFQSRIAPIANRVVANSQSAISRTETNSKETPLGDLIADAQRARASAQLAFMNPGGIRADLDAGEVTFGELATIQPFDNGVFKLELTGDQIRRLLEQQLFPVTPSARTRILQISGFRYAYDARRPQGARVDPASLVLENGTPIIPTQRYTVAANEFIASGGDSFTVFKEGTKLGGFGSDLDALEAYVKSLPQPFPAPNPTANPRITRTG